LNFTLLGFSCRAESGHTPCIGCIGGIEGLQAGNLGLSEPDENDIVAFLKTLTDGHGKSYPGDLPPAKNEPASLASFPSFSPGFRPG
jgi:hypothetical protein